jgi:hypothetical protein
MQANSGGGKSWALRRLLEQTHGKVQQIVIDPEGEFASLREKFDYVLAARQGGDTLADPRTAKLLAERLLELGVSAILDIYELKPRERVSVREAVPRGARRRAEAALASGARRARRGARLLPGEGPRRSRERDAVKGCAAAAASAGSAWCRDAAAVEAGKDVAAECNNKLIGRTGLDVDMARAGDELGFTKGDRLQLRDLEDGEFFAFGPALTKAGHASR